MTVEVFVAAVLSLLVGATFGLLWGRVRNAETLARISADRDSARSRIAELTGERRDVFAQVSNSAVVKDSLDRLHERLRGLEQLGPELQRTTAALSTAFHKPQVRGKWGELHLRRTVELAGMVKHCDFAEQVTLAGPSGQARIRPDLVVNLAGGKHFVVDAKVPLTAYLEAMDCADLPTREEWLRKHARHVRSHVDQLASKAYWTGVENTPEFVILYVPTESILSSALDSDSSLLEYASTKQVILASPTTLISVLRTAAYAWSQAALTESAREVFTLSRQLYERLSTMGDHLAGVGKSLTAAVDSYNRCIGSVERRVLPTARRLQDLHVTDAELTTPVPVEASVRSIAAPELFGDIKLVQ